MLDESIISAVRERSKIARRVHLPVVTEAPAAALHADASGIHAPVDPAAIAVATDRFRCVELRGVLSADSCVKRQIRAVPHKYRSKQVTSWEVHNAVAAKLFIGCAQCATGREIAERIGAQIPEPRE